MTCLTTKDFLDLVETDETVGPALQTNSAGVLQWNPHNLLKSSEDFSSSDWAKTNTTVTSNAAMSPDGTLTADKISHTSTSALIRQTNTVTAGVNYEYAVAMKYVDHQWVAIAANNSAAPYFTWFDIQNGAVGVDGSDGATIKDLGDGWFMLSCPQVSNDTSSYFEVHLVADDNSTAETSGTSAYIWGAHLYRNDLGGMAKVPESDRALAALEYYVPNKAVVTGSNLVSNGTFDTSTAGWTAIGAQSTISAVGGNLRVEQASGGSGARAEVSFPTTVGEVYRVSVDFAADTTTGNSFIYVGSTSAGVDVLNLSVGSNLKTWVVYFTATSTTSYLSVANSSTALTGEYSEWDNITVEEVDRNPSAARYLPRRDHYINGERHLLVEPDGATNYITHSADLANAAWAKSSYVTIASNDTSTPFGMLADKIEFSATTSALHQVQFPSLASDTYCAWGVFKADEEDEISLWLANATQRAVFDLTNGTVNNISLADAGIYDMGDGWYLCWGRSTTATTSIRWYMRDGNTPFSGVVGEGLYCAFTQAEPGLVPTSYIPTSGSAVPRGAETTTIPASVMDSLGLFNTVAVDGTELVTNGTFDTDLTGWTQTGNDASNYWEWVSGAAHVVSAGSFVPLGQTCLTTGKCYELTLDVTVVAGGIKIGSSNTAIYNEVAVNISASGIYTFRFAALSDTLYFGRYSGVTDVTIDNISVKEIHRRGIGVQMHGHMSYGDDGTNLAIVPFQYEADTSNFVKAQIRLEGSDTGTFRVWQAAEGTGDAEDITDAYSPGVMVPFKIAGRFLDNSLQGAADGVATTENTTPVGLPDLTGVDMEIAYSGPAIAISKFNIFAENQKAGDGTFKMDQTFVEKATS